MATKPRNFSSSSPTSLSPSRAPSSRTTAARSPAVAIGTGNGGRKSTSGCGSLSSPSSPATSAVLASGSAGRTPQTRRKELSLTSAGSPSGSPKTSSPLYTKKHSKSESNSVRKTSTAARSSAAAASGTGSRRPTYNRGRASSHSGPPGASQGGPRSNARDHHGVHHPHQREKHNNKHVESSDRDSSATTSTGSSSVGSDHTGSVNAAHRVGVGGVPTKVREETKFDGLWDVKTIENGVVRIPTQLLDELISKESIEKFYEVEDKPVAR